MRRFLEATALSLVAILVLCAPASGSVLGAGAAPAVTPADGKYRGTTAQGYAVKFAVRQGAIQPDVLFKISGSGGCSLTIYYTVRATKVKSNGTFKLSSGGMTVTGKFVSSTLVKGKLSAPSCESAPDAVSFSAKRRG
ncbi:MAG: hypothetical protein IT201_03565 [Thermoleophilia bacterium]|nr:hypothetical protein [Thermoleophilia bacterium]